MAQCCEKIMGTILIAVGSVLAVIFSFVMIVLTVSIDENAKKTFWENDCQDGSYDSFTCLLVPACIPIGLALVFLGVIFFTFGTGAIGSACGGTCRMLCGLPFRCLELCCLPRQVGVACGVPSVPTIGTTLPALDLTEACFKILLVCLTMMTGLLLITYGDEITSNLIGVLTLVLNAIVFALAALGHFLTGSVVGLLTETTHLFLQQLLQLVMNMIVNIVAESLRHVLEKYNELELKIELEALECKEKEGPYYKFQDDNDESVKSDEKAPKKKGQRIYIATPTIKLGADKNHSFELVKKSDHKPGDLALAGADFGTRVKMEATVTIKLSENKKGLLGKVFSCFSAFLFSSGLPEGISISAPHIVITAQSSDDASCTTDWKNACCSSKNAESDVDIEGSMEQKLPDSGRKFLTEGWTPVRCCNKKEASEEFKKAIKNGLNEVAGDVQDQVGNIGNIQGGFV